MDSSRPSSPPALATNGRADCRLAGSALVQQRDERHGGRVMARNDGPGEASEVAVRLPAATAEHTGLPIAQPRPIQTTRRSARVLVVDDNEDLARGLARLLEFHGHQVQVAHDGPAGVEIAKQWQPEFVLLDIGLPGMDGYQVTAALRQDVQTKGAVIVAISGYGEDEDRLRSMEAGFDHHLVKPINPSELQQILANIKSSQPPGRRAPQ